MVSNGLGDLLCAVQNGKRASEYHSKRPALFLVEHPAENRGRTVDETALILGIKGSQREFQSSYISEESAVIVCIVNGTRSPTLFKQSDFHVVS